MESSIIDKIVGLRDRLNVLLPKSIDLRNLVTFANVIIVSYFLYLLGIAIYILDACAVDKKRQPWKKALTALGKVIGFNIILYGAVFLSIFIFPESMFVIFLRKVSSEYPFVFSASFILLIIVGIVSACVGGLSNTLRARR
ncbi:MAG: hypothetical protein JSW40_03175 [Candidatus Omnitrophota bacterium]|nr:MAG: hypothetical protein JSW40_03175 [Candidatus Omnitrophota bacterium]